MNYRECVCLLYLRRKAEKGKIVNKMNHLFEGPFNATDFLRFIAIVLFGGIIILSFIYGTLLGWLFKKQDPKNDFHKEPTKVIGGLSVLLVALIANTPVIYGIALFIGGLLIASEKFMINLAAIFNSDRKNVHKISDHWTEATPSQIEEKQEREAEENAIVEEAQDKSGNKKNTPSQNPGEIIRSVTNHGLDKIKNIEALTLSYFRKKVSNQHNKSLIEYVDSRDTDTERRRIYDAIVIDGSNNVTFGIEIRYIDTIRPILLRTSTKKAIERMKSIHFPLLVAVTYQDEGSFSPKNFKDYIAYIHETYDDVGIVFYKVSDGKLKAVEESDLEKMLKSNRM